ncbi:uncharacterized protein VTP21DRAFT_824 [Calcarisporiella thermophila]|uniref:uncharacterized protein n=1 Tax=Calcarisporiella thermophila TaxID=911321 RepID=UPI0037421413
MATRRKPANTTEGIATKEIKIKASSPPRKQKSILKELVQNIILLLVLSLSASYLVTGTWTWGYEGKYTNWRHWIPRKELVFSEAELAKYDGSDPNLPIYIAIDGDVFDVSVSPMHYGKGGGYNIFAGKDAARAYVTGCFQNHLTHDLRGLTKDQLKALDGWKRFYRDSSKYFKVGRVEHPPVDGPIPPDCEEPVPNMH